MASSFHVVREIVRREVVLCQAEDERAAHALVGHGGGELIDSENSTRVVGVEETTHSKRRRAAARVRSITPSPVAEDYGAGVQGDGLLTPSRVTIIDDGEHHAPSNDPIFREGFEVVPPSHLHVGHMPQPESGNGDEDGGHWRKLHPGEQVEAGDEYHLGAIHGWQVVGPALIGHAISPQARAPFRRRRA